MIRTVVPGWHLPPEGPDVDPDEELGEALGDQMESWTES